MTYALADKPLSEAIARAELAAKSAKTLDELRRALTVLLTVSHELTITEAAKAMGRSPSWVAYARRAFIQDGVTSKQKNHGGRRNQIMSEPEEVSFMDEACRRFKHLAQQPWWRGDCDLRREDIQIHRVVRNMLVELTGRQIPLSTAFALMSRVGKRKFSDYSPAQWETYARIFIQT